MINVKFGKISMPTVLSSLQMKLRLIKLLFKYKSPSKTEDKEYKLYMNRF